MSFDAFVGCSHRKHHLVSPVTIDLGSLGKGVKTDTQRVPSSSDRSRLESAWRSSITIKLMPREIEHGEATDVAATESDSGEIITFEDGSVSVPLFEEQLVVGNTGC